MRESNLRLHSLATNRYPRQPVKDEIRALADRYAVELKRNIDARVADMEQDDRSHVLVYEVLDISKDEGKLIDVYQNKGRFLYKYAGSFLEEAAKFCFKTKFPDFGSRSKHARQEAETFRRGLSGGRRCFGNQVARCDDGWRPHHQGAYADAGRS